MSDALPQSGVMALRDLIAGLWPDPIPARCGITVCGGARLGVGSLWPIDADTTAFCGSAICGRAHCGRIIPNNGIFGGSLPVMYSHRVTIGITEDQGGPADPRQVYNTAYDNPGMTVRIVGEDMQTLDRVAERIRAALDMGRHLETPHGTINGLNINPPTRTIRKDRPRYEVDLTVEAELIRPETYY